MAIEIKRCKQDDECRQVSSFPMLATLRLEAADFDALSRQGTVHQEQKGRNTHYKLRFRRSGRPVVRYIADSAKAARIREELAVLQRNSKALRALRATTRRAASMLRNAKQQLQPELLSRGYKFHGLAIRKTRSNTESG